MNLLTANSISNVFLTEYVRIVDGLISDPISYLESKRREMAFTTSKIKERAMAVCLEAEIAGEIGCDLKNSKVFSGKSFELKCSSQKILSKKHRSHTLAKDIIIKNSRSISKIYKPNSTYFMFNFDEDRVTFICSAEDVAKYVVYRGNEVHFNTRYFKVIDVTRVDWPELPENIVDTPTIVDRIFGYPVWWEKGLSNTERIELFKNWVYHCRSNTLEEFYKSINVKNND